MPREFFVVELTDPTVAEELVKLCLSRGQRGLSIGAGDACMSWLLHHTVQDGGGGGGQDGQGQMDGETSSDFSNSLEPLDQLEQHQREGDEQAVEGGAVVDVSSLFSDEAVVKREVEEEEEGEKDSVPQTHALSSSPPDNPQQSASAVLDGLLGPGSLKGLVGQDTAGRAGQGRKRRMQKREHPLFDYTLSSSPSARRRAEKRKSDKFLREQRDCQKCHRRVDSHQGQHVLTHHYPPHAYHCPQCRQPIKSKWNLQRHMLSQGHSGEIADPVDYTLLENIRLECFPGVPRGRARRSESRQGGATECLEMLSLMMEQNMEQNNQSIEEEV